VEDTAIGASESVRRKAAEYTRQLRKLSEDLRTKEFEASLESAALFERYGLGPIEQSLAAK